MRIECGIVAENAGLFVHSTAPRAALIHPERTLASHELILVRRSTLEMIEAGRERIARAGHAMLLRAGRRHRGLRPYESDVEFYWIHFRFQPGSAAARSWARLASVVAVARPERLAELFHRFMDDQESGSLSPARASLLVGLMLCELTPAHGPVRPTSSVVRRVVEHVDRHFARPISAADVAASLGYHPDYLGRMVRRELGHTPTELIHHRRLGEARALLRESTLSIKQIASRTGFGHPVTLRQLFLRHEGMTPRGYRALYARQHLNHR